MATDEDLLRRFAIERDEPAFTELVRRRIDFVYAIALRQVGGDAHLAQDAAQEVFLDLARKARAVAAAPALVSWLYTATRFAAAKVRRRQTRWLNREQAALTMNTILSDGTDPQWETLRPVLDEAMHELGEQDRAALLLRYFENRPLAEVGAKLGLAENSARMRVDRALDKLRARLAKRGIASSAAALGSVLAAQPAITAPVGLAASAASGALMTVATGQTAAVGALFLAMKKTSLAAAGSFLVALTTTVFVVQHRASPAAPPVPPAASPAPKAAPAPAQTAASAPAIAAATTAPVILSSNPLDLDQLIADAKSQQNRQFDEATLLKMERDAQQARSAQVREQARQMADPNATPSPAVNPAALGNLADASAALAFFRAVALEDLPAHLQYIEGTLPSERRQLLLPTLFQAWFERDAAGALATATTGGPIILNYAVPGWAAVDLRGAWNWVEGLPTGQRVGNYWRMLINTGVASGQAPSLAAWIQASAPGMEANERRTVISNLVGAWASRDVPAAEVWLRQMGTVYHDAVSQAAASLGNGAANLPPEEFDRLLAGLDDTAWQGVVRGAVISWVGSSRTDRLRQFLAQASSLSDARHDVMLRGMGVSLEGKGDSDLALEVYRQIRNPQQRDDTLSSLGGNLAGTKPGLALQAILAVRDRTIQARQLINTYLRLQKQNPAASKRFLDQPGFPVDVRTKLLEQE